MPSCTFCADEISAGTGMLYVKKDGSFYHFCSSKCRKNTLKLKREGRRQRWTHAYRVFKGKEKGIADKKPVEAKKTKSKG